MKLFRVIKFDLIEGIVHRKRTFLLLWLFSTVICFDIQTRILCLQEDEGATILDYLLYFFSGMKKYVPTPSEFFKLPILWYLLFSLIFFIPLKYIVEDLNGVGCNILYRSESRTIWWLSKCIWNILTITIVFAIVWLQSSIYCILAGGNLAFTITPSIGSILDLDTTFLPFDEWHILQEITILPLLTSISLSIWQMLLVIYLGPMFSYIFIQIILISSAYYSNPLFIGNYLMVLRSSNITDEGVSPSLGIILSLIIAILGIICGTFLFRTYDILEKQE